MAVIRQVVDDWAKIVIQIWEEKMLALGISDSYQLANSFIYHILAHSGGDPTRLEFAFNYYGKFVDMGVGRGVKLADRYNSKRTVKPWYTKTFLREVKKLAVLLAGEYAHQGAVMIVENVEDNSTGTRKI